MPERSLEGIQITETPGAEQPIARASAHLTAFVGRTLRGPLNRPIIVQQLRGFSAAVRRPVAAEPAVLRGRAFLRAGRTPGGHRSRRERRRARHAFAALRHARRCSSKRARRARANSCAPRSTTITSTPTTSSASISSCSACARRAPSASRRRRLSARCRSIRQSPRFVAGALLESNLVRVRGARAVGAPRSHADAGHEPAGRLRELQSRRRRRPPDHATTTSSAPRRAAPACSRSRTSTSWPSSISRR